MDPSRSALLLRWAKAQGFGELWREKCTRAPWTFPSKLARTSDRKGRPERADGRRPKATFTRYWPIFQPVTNSPHIPQAKNIPYQPLLIKPIFSVLAYTEKQRFSKLVFQYQFVTWVFRLHGTTLTIQKCRSFGIQIFRPPKSSVNL